MSLRNLFLFLPLFKASFSSKTYESSCYEAPSCTATQFYDKASGFTNDTGFSSPGSSECCQICLPGTQPTVCFNKTDLDCKKKTGNADFDYLLLDQIWQPEFCNSLRNGFDPTLTHLEGSTCYTSADTPPPQLTIHGLWPNYWNGYPQCCNATSDTYALGEEVTEWSMWPTLQEQWPDPTAQPGSSCAVCLMLNHEWLKHGGCYSPGEPKVYFADTLHINSIISEQTAKINEFAGKIVTTSSLKQLYSKNVNILCNPNSGEIFGGNKSIGSFLELRTCWSTENVPIDCPESSSGTFTAPCPKYTYLLA